MKVVLGGTLKSSVQEKTQRARRGVGTTMIARYSTITMRRLRFRYSVLHRPLQRSHTMMGMYMYTVAK